MKPKLKNLLILGSFFSNVLLAVLIYYLNERVSYLEKQERILQINFKVEKNNE